MTVFDPKKFRIVNYFTKFVIQNLGLDPYLDWIRIHADSAKYLDTDSVSVNLDPNHCKGPAPPPPGHHVSKYYSSGKLFLQNINKSILLLK
jgi:hypothetical protein